MVGWHAASPSRGQLHGHVLVNRGLRLCRLLPAGPLLPMPLFAEIADAAFDPENYRQIMGVLARRLQERVSRAEARLWGWAARHAGATGKVVAGCWSYTAGLACVC